jgi:hypothetical protein
LGGIVARGYLKKKARRERTLQPCIAAICHAQSGLVGFDSTPNLSHLFFCERRTIDQIRIVMSRTEQRNNISFFKTREKGRKQEEINNFFFWLFNNSLYLIL